MSYNVWSHKVSIDWNKFKHLYIKVPRYEEPIVDQDQESGMRSHEVL